MRTPVRHGVALALLVCVLLSRPALAGEKEAREAVATFKKAYSSKDESARIKAVEDLGAIQHKVIVEALSAPLSRDPAAAVRRAAAKALGGQWAATAPSALVKALAGEAEHDVEVAIIAALGETGADAAVPALVARLVPKRAGTSAAAGEEEPSADTGPALDALAKIGSSHAIEDLIAFLSKDAALRAKRRGSSPPGPLTKKAEAALTAITGQTRSGVNEWRRWWNESKDALKLVAVHRCDATGKTLERSAASSVCPHCSGDSGKCGAFLRTRLDGTGAAPEKKSR